MKRKLNTTVCLQYSTFRFYLPDAKNLHEPQIAEEFSTEDIYIDAEIFPETEAEQKKDNAKTILVVEDNADMRKYIKTELSADYNIVLTSDANNIYLYYS